MTVGLGSSVWRFMPMYRCDMLMSDLTAIKYTADTALTAWGVLLQQRFGLCGQPSLSLWGEAHLDIDKLLCKLLPRCLSAVARSPL